MSHWLLSVFDNTIVPTFLARDQALFSFRRRKTECMEAAKIGPDLRLQPRLLDQLDQFSHCDLSDFL